MANALVFENMAYFGNELLMQLKKRLLMAGLVNTSLGGAASAPGETIYVPFLNFSGTARTRLKGGAVVVDDIGSGTVPITLSHKYVAVAMDNLDRTFASVDLMTAAAQRISYGLAEGVDSMLTGLYNEIPYEVGETDATTAFNATDKLLHLSAARKMLMNNKSLMSPLYGILGTSEAHALRTLAEVYKVNEAGTTGPRFEGDLGRIYGIDLRETQQIQSSILSATAAWGTPLIDLVAGYPIGTTTIHVDGVGNGADILKGSTFSLGGESYVVTATATASTQDIDLVIYPALKTAVVNDQALTPLLHTNATARSHNLVFHPDAIGLAIRPMAEMVSGSGPLTRVITDPDTGLSMRLSVQSSAIGGAGVAFTETLVVDMLCGAKVLQPAGAVRIEGLA